MRGYEKLRQLAQRFVDLAEIDFPDDPIPLMEAFDEAVKVLAETPETSEMERLVEWLSRKGDETLAIIIDRERRREVSTAWLSGQLAGFSEIDDYIKSEFLGGEDAAE